MIVITGGYRTGSTLAFNLVRELTGFEAVGESSPLYTDKNIIYKAHGYTGRGIKVHTVRGYYEAAKSMKRIGFDDDKIIRSINLNMNVDYAMQVFYDAIWLDFFRKDFAYNARILIRFLENNLRTELRYIDLLEWTKERVKSITDSLTEADPVTQLRPNHIGDSSNVQLSEKVINFIKYGA